MTAQAQNGDGPLGAEKEGTWSEADRLAEAIAGEVETWQGGDTGARLDHAVLAELDRYQERRGNQVGGDNRGSQSDPRIVDVLNYCDAADEIASKGRIGRVSGSLDTGAVRHMLTRPADNPPTPTPAEMLAAFAADSDMNRLVVNYPEFGMTLERS